MCLEWKVVPGMEIASSQTPLLISMIDMLWTIKKLRNLSQDCLKIYATANSVCLEWKIMPGIDPASSKTNILIPIMDMVWTI